MHDLVVAAQENRALTRDGDTVNGLYYRPFLDWVRAAFGITGQVVEDVQAVEALTHVRDDQVFVASVSSEIRYPSQQNERRGGHLVLVHAVHDGRLTFHNPSGVRDTADGASLDIGTFSRFFAGRGFTLRLSVRPAAGNLGTV